MSLTTQANVKEALDIDGTDDDNYIDNLILRVDAFVKRYLGRQIESGSVTETHDGTGHSELILRDRPIVSVTTLHQSVDHVFDASTLIAAADYVVDDRRGRIFLKNAVTFQAWIQNIQVVYVAGYAAVPADIEDAAIMLIGSKLNRRNVQGVSSKTLGDGSISYFRSEDLTKEIRNKLDLFRRHKMIA